MKSIISILLLSTLLIGLHGQTRTIRGKVVDGLKPLPGTNVYEKGTTNGTVTDLKGEFTLDVSEGKEVTLIFSFMCPTTEKKVKKNDSFIKLNIQLREKRLYTLLATSLTSSSESGSLSGTMAIGYNSPFYAYGIGGELSLLPIRSSTNSTDYQLGIPVYGSIRLFHRISGLFGAGYFWSLSDNGRNDFKIHAGLLYRRRAMGLDLRYYNGTRSYNENSSEVARNLNLGLRIYVN